MCIRDRYLDNVQISTLTTIDDTVYMDSQELHWIRVRQQDPTSSLWSLCVVRMFGSRNGARISIWVQWIQYNVSLDVYKRQEQIYKQKGENNDDKFQNRDTFQTERCV